MHRKLKEILRIFAKSINRFGFHVTGDDWRFGLTSPALLLKELGRFRPRHYGWELVRIGGLTDGSYLLPNDLEKIKYCFSPGYGGMASFEKDLEDRYGVKSFVIDPKIPIDPKILSNVTFTEGYLGWDPKGKFLGLDDWLASLDVEVMQDQVILQMDIEGAEWEVLYAVSEKLLSKFRIIVIELHQLELLLNRLMFDKVYKRVINKLLQYFDVVHIHPNNVKGSFKVGKTEFPHIVEVTLHNKRRRKSNQERWAILPHSLDSPSRTDLRDIGINWPFF